MAVGDKYPGTMASEVTTDIAGLDGVRDSKDSDWSSFTVPNNCCIAKDLTVVSVISEAGSEHSYELQYADDVVVVPGTPIAQPRTIRVKTHARSSDGPRAGRGWEKVKVDFTYVQFAN